MKDKFDYIMGECARQWKENQEEEHGEWILQDDDTVAEYYNDMAKHLEETGRLPEFPKSDEEKFGEMLESIHSEAMKNVEHEEN